MLLYHYASSPYANLSTRRFRENLTPEQLQGGIDKAAFVCDPKPYYDHVSFFTCPIPVLTVAELYKGMNHPFWKVDGSTIYEHVAESDDIGSFEYMFVECPLHVEFMKKHWTGKSDADKALYFKRLDVLARSHGLTGKGNADFTEVARSLPQELSVAWRDSFNDPRNREVIKTLYAPSIPHVMLYPSKCPVKLERKPRAFTLKTVKQIQATTSNKSRHWA